jgi:catechol 2,3-dioxygenase-like lactoylglutathione lyase family enzyme
MSTTATRGQDATTEPRAAKVALKLEVAIVPVSDVERAAEFYRRLGWRLDADVVAGEIRILQFTPPGSQCSIIFGKGVVPAKPGSADNLVLAVNDLEAARSDLSARGVKVSEVFHYSHGPFIDDVENPHVNGRDPQGRSYFSFASFEDPDGNVWLLQEITQRIPGRVTGDTTYASVSDLAQALRRAEAAHGPYEARLGQRDENWPEWYAEFLVREQRGEGLPH